MSAIPNIEADTAALEPEQSAIRKAFRRLMPWLMLFYLLAYIDRVNIGFAALTMNAHLGLTATMFGIAGAAFYVTYILFEVPSNMMLARYGARIWIPRIMITWGIASAVTLFAVGPTSLYSFRALLGAAEAGLFPGILYYLGGWFPDSQRARANSIFLTALPIALVVGAPVSGFLLQMDGILGLHGWQWLFLIEGVVTILVGVAAYFALPDSPVHVTWLTPEERTALQRRLEAENRQKSALNQTPKQTHTIWHELVNIRVIGLGLASFCAMGTMTVIGTWLPLFVRELLGNTDRILLVTFASAIPPLAAIPVMLIVGKYCDRSQKHVLYTSCAMAFSTVGWLVCITAPTPSLRVVGLSIATAGAYAAMTTFWATVARFLPRERHAVGMALIASISTLTSIVSPIVTGVLRDWTGNYKAGMWYAAVLMFIGIGLLVLVTRRKPS